MRRAQPQPAGAVQVYERGTIARFHVSDAEPIRLDKAFAKSLSHVLPFHILRARVTTLSPYRRDRRIAQPGTASMARPDSSAANGAGSRAMSCGHRSKA